LTANFLEKSLITSLFKKGLSENPEQRRDKPAQRFWSSDVTLADQGLYF